MEEKELTKKDVEELEDLTGEIFDELFMRRVADGKTRDPKIRELLGRMKKKIEEIGVI